MKKGAELFGKTKARKVKSKGVVVPLFECGLRKKSVNHIYKRR